MGVEALKNLAKIYQLSSEQVFSYFLDHIQCGKYMSQATLKNTDFKNGNFFTILPGNVSRNKILDFHHGGIVSSSYISEGCVKEVWTMDSECAEFITNFLKKDKNNLAIIENYMLDPQSPFVELKNVKTAFLDSEVYYVLDDKNSDIEVYKAIRKLSLVWHFLVILTRAQKKPPSILTRPIVDKLCRDIQFVIVGAYDGEGYIFWEKT